MQFGKVSLHVNNLEIMQEFYGDVLGLTSNSVVELLHRPDVLRPESNDAGLYHLAIVHETQAGLGQTLDSVLAKTPHLFHGSADHLVSEAFYLNDPEGNGIEIYFDRPRDTWQWNDGQVVMATLPLDPRQYIDDHLTDTQQPDKRIGHVHLKVGDIAQAKEFYVDILGFDITFALPTALFVSRDGYHHHIGLNTWHSLGAGVRGETFGLASIEMSLPQQAFDSLQQSLSTSNIEHTKQDHTLSFSDPWGNKLTVTTA